METEDQPVALPEAQRGKFLRWAWVPFAVTVGALAAAVISSGRHTPAWFINVVFSLYVVGVLYFMVQAIGRLCLRQWKAALWAGVRLVTCVLAFIPAASLVFFSALFGPSEDGFAKGLTIPTNSEVIIPLEAPSGTDNSQDTFQTAMVAALRSPPAPKADSSITPSFPSLRLLERDHRPLLMRYLASHPAWRVFEEYGALCATRRWQKGGTWLWDLHGYYNDSDLDRWNENDFSRFQSRTTLGLNGKPWTRNQRGASWMDEGTNAQKVTLTKGNGMDQSHCVVRCGAMLVELFEQSSGSERRLTQTALKVMESEFKTVLERKVWGRELLPAGATRSGRPLLNLYQGFQPGIYDVESWFNPGEPGTIYVRAYEVTRNTRLSADRLYESSNERIGWSDTPDELFLYNTHVTIYEGDWGQPYAARFELWFKPESGAPERKLLQRTFKIEGWQR